MPAMPSVTTFIIPQSYSHNRVDATVVACTIYLPLAANFVGHELCILKIDSSAHAVTVAVALGSSDTLNLPAGRNPLTSQWQVLRLRSTGTGWELAV